MPQPSDGSDRSRRYCLDANLSYRLAEALSLVGWPVEHVSSVPGLGTDGLAPGRCDAEDPEIGRWCRDTNTVLVTFDDDFKVRRARAWSLTDGGAEVILFEYALPGLREPHAQLTRLLPAWDRELGRFDYGPRLWSQVRNRTKPVLVQRAAGAKKRRGNRPALGNS